MQPRRVLLALSITQITSWGVLYYTFPVALADTGCPVGRDNGLAAASARGTPFTNRM
ncbi:hypothetical protein [Blastococcus tunisiensis]|uniref:MFS transporter n=1 Tax=Blastococcus tunisiensis TaxID=1798228 RepID=A0A1I2JYW2_9ACTN|nr:hypothetical protein [Blastococcus sp. DSM 46838]SFF59258.1 hypothetical protein SAMN05216574_11860 [Blastococcus sp. DSM 46838]